MNAVYLRVSSVSQSYESQKLVVDKYLEGQGIKEFRLYADKNTGDDTERPQLQQLEKDIFNGDVKLVIVYKLDRLSRSLRDGINLLCLWLHAGVRIVSVTQQLDFSGVTGKLVASVLFAVAEMEQETRRERQAAGIAVAKQKGKYKGGVTGRRSASPTKAYNYHMKGYPQHRIASIMGISERSVRRYIKEVKKKKAAKSSLSL